MGNPMKTVLNRVEAWITIFTQYLSKSFKSPGNHFRRLRSIPLVNRKWGVDWKSTQNLKIPQYSSTFLRMLRATALFFERKCWKTSGKKLSQRNEVFWRNSFRDVTKKDPDKPHLCFQSSNSSHTKNDSLLYKVCEL